MNADDDYYDGDMSMSEYYQRIRQQERSDRYYAAQNEKYKLAQAQSKVIYPKCSDDDFGSMW